MFRYTKNMDQASRIFRDRPMSPIETGVFWVEFVLRNDGQTNLMKPLSYEQPFWERHLMDIFAAVVILFLNKSDEIPGGFGFNF